jgi:hypothetical protein
MKWSSAVSLIAITASVACTHAGPVLPVPVDPHAGHVESPQTAQQHGHAPMTMVTLGSGWMAIGMAQAFPTATIAFPSDDASPLERKGLYITQPALMFNLESPGSRVTMRTTVNLEGITQPGGELTFGGWGEGFIDKRHPHTFLHEAMLSLNLRRGENNGLSLSVGKGFAPYGTDDPMMRPVVKYPTNHHLSQILERWTVSGVWANRDWSLEAGVFGGAEPTGPWDLSNIESFGDSWSGRITRRIGTGVLGAWPWEFAGSVGRIREEHDGSAEVTRLYNLAIRHEHDHGATHMYTLVEASLSDPTGGTGNYSIVGEGSLQRGGHKPYGRIELATRPEWSRTGVPSTRGFFRYDHDAEPIGATRWLILTAGYGFTATALPFSARPYVEAQFNHVRAERGGISPSALYGRSTFWSVSAGFRVFLGGDPMRMGSYGINDPMTLMHRMQMQMGDAAPDAQHRH